MTLTILTTLLKLVGFDLSAKAVKRILIVLAIVIAGGMVFGVYKAVDRYLNQAKEDAVTIEKLEGKVDDLGKSNESLSEAIDELGKTEDIKTEVRVEANEKKEATAEKTNSIIKKKDEKIKAVVEKAKTQEPTKEAIVAKDLEITIIVIDSMWQAYCNDNTTATECKG